MGLAQKQVQLLKLGSEEAGQPMTPRDQVPGPGTEICVMSQRYAGTYLGQVSTSLALEGHLWPEPQGAPAQSPPAAFSLQYMEQRRGKRPTCECSHICQCHCRHNIFWQVWHMPVIHLTEPQAKKKTGTGLLKPTNGPSPPVSCC